MGEDGEEHTYTYNRLYREMNRFANALKRLGVKKGDRVLIGKYSGNDIKMDDEEFVIVREDEILCVIEKKK